jgi:tetratricopeptide (TPR) repeat protein
MTNVNSSPVTGSLVTVSELEDQVAAHPDRTDLSMQLADLLLEKGDDLQAAQRYHQIVLSNARNLDAWSKAILAYASAGEASLAIELSDEALLLFPGFVPVEVARVYALRAAGRNTEALHLAEEIIKRPVDPNFIELVERLKQELDDA